MLAPTYQDSSYQYRASPGVRIASAVLALGVIALMILALMRLGVLPPAVPRDEVKSTTFTLTPAPKIAPSRMPSIEKVKHVTSGGAPRKLAPVTKAPPPTPAPPVPWNVTPLTRQEFATSDISKLPTHERAGPQLGEGEGTGSGKDSGSATGAGQGPGGEQLYNAEWYRRPTDAELAFYMPKTHTGSGWAEIACKTIDHYHVEDCSVLGESPGSGLGRTLREAAWQFLVRPPRIGGEPQVGAWVRIHFDFTEREVKE